jgi:hypothetical protein
LAFSREGEVLGMTHKPLPAEEGLDIQALSRLFDDTTNSYKLLFFRSVLQMIGQDQVQSDRSIYLSEIVVKMLANAYCWYNISIES